MPSGLRFDFFSSSQVLSALPIVRKFLFLLGCIALTLPVPRCFSLSLSLGLPPLVAFFLLWVSLVTGLGVRRPSAFRGSPLPPLVFAAAASADYELLPVASCFRLVLRPSSYLGSLFSLLYVI